ncbi:hypothetical protein Holit_02850 [Hollandina sp. SP2]
MLQCSPWGLPVSTYAPFGAVTTPLLPGILMRTMFSRFLHVLTHLIDTRSETVDKKIRVGDWEVAILHLGKCAQ